MLKAQGYGAASERRQRPGEAEYRSRELAETSARSPEAAARGARGIHRDWRATATVAVIGYRLEAWSFGIGGAAFPERRHTAHHSSTTSFPFGQIGCGYAALRGRLLTCGRLLIGLPKSVVGSCLKCAWKREQRMLSPRCVRRKTAKRFASKAMTDLSERPRPGSGLGACSTFTPVGSRYEWIRAASMVAVGCGFARSLGVVPSANLLNGVPRSRHCPAEQHSRNQRKQWRFT